MRVCQGIAGKSKWQIVYKWLPQTPEVIWLPTTLLIPLMINPLPEGMHLEIDWVALCLGPSHAWSQFGFHSSVDVFTSQYSGNPGFPQQLLQLFTIAIL